jgi:hypothetical protein
MRARWGPWRPLPPRIRAVWQTTSVRNHASGRSQAGPAGPRFPAPGTHPGIEPPVRWPAARNPKSGTVVPVRQGSCPGRVPSGGRRVPAPSHCSPGRDCHSVGSGGLRSRGGSTAGTRRAQGSPRRGIDRSRRAWSTGLHEPITLFCTSGPASMASIASRNSPTPTS